MIAVVYITIGVLNYVGNTKRNMRRCHHMPKKCGCFMWCQPDCNCVGHSKKWKDHRIDHIHRHEHGVYDG